MLVLNLDQMTLSLKSQVYHLRERHQMGLPFKYFLQAGILDMKTEAWSKINENESFIGVIYSKIAILEGTLQGISLPLDRNRQGMWVSVVF